MHIDNNAAEDGATTCQIASAKIRGRGLGLKSWIDGCGVEDLGSSGTRKSQMHEYRPCMRGIESFETFYAEACTYVHVPNYLSYYCTVLIRDCAAESLGKSRLLLG